MPPLLELQGVHTHFPVARRGPLARRRAGTVRAVDGVDLTLAEGEVLGLVGESGCGKSTLGRTIVHLIRPTAGRVLFAGRDLAALPAEELRRARAGFQMIFQDPYASLNPRMTVFSALAEAIAAHRPDIPRAGLPDRVSALLIRVGLSPQSAWKYPHEFSGGQRQRIALARALAVEPRLLVADEPVSALDVSLQAHILNLIAGLVRELRLSVILISHDLGAVRHLADRIAVMYLGRLVETGPAEEVFARPLHPYTQALVSAVPIPDPVLERARERVLLAGHPPPSLNPPAGCRFHPRCPHAVTTCRVEDPPLRAHGGLDRWAACPRVREVN